MKDLSQTNSKAGWQGVLTDVLFCLLLTCLVAANIWRDPGPWVDPFFQSGRFDAQIGIVGTFIQAAEGERVDCLVWPGLPGLARGAMLLKTLKLDTSPVHQLAEPARKRAFYSLIAKASAWSNAVAVPGMLILVLATFWLIRAVGNTRLPAFAASAYLAVSQMCSTQIGWARTEAWSLAFLALAMVMMVPEIKRWLQGGACGPDSCRLTGLRVVLCGFFAASAILDKVLVAPAVVCLSVFFIWILWKQSRQALFSSRNQSGAMAWCLLPVLLCPWWALAFPSKEYWSTVSMYDASSAELLGPMKWHLFAAGLVFLAVMPAILFFGITFLRRYWNKAHVRVEGILPVVFVIARLITGGLAALYFWAAIISPNWAYFQSTVSHVLTMLAASFLGSSPYAQAQSGLFAAIAYFWNSGAELGRPNLFDLANVAGVAIPALRWVNPASVSSVFGLLAVVLIVSKKLSSPTALRFTCVALLFFALMLVSDFLASTRGALGLDFRYYIYSGWFGIVGLALFCSGVVPAGTSSPRGRAINISLAVFSIAIVGFGLFVGTPSASQLALFGRQIHVGALTAPNLFRKAGVLPDSSDWRLLLSWCPVNAQKDFQTLASVNSDAASRFEREPDPEGGLSVRCMRSGSPERLQMRNSIEIAPQQSERCTLALSGYLHSTHPEHIPSIGLVVENKTTGKVMQYRWAIVSSAWGPGDDPVEYAVAVPFQPSAERAFVLVDWAPVQAGERMTIRNLAFGLMPRQGLMLSSNGEPQPALDH
jgi:hypothetical protein